MFFIPLERAYPAAAMGLALLLALPVVGSGCTPAAADDAPAAHGAEKLDPTTLVKTRLVADVDAVAPGQTFQIAAVFDIKKDWHIYWENPGDSGLATQVKLTAPSGYDFTPVAFPGPDRYELPGGVINYGYDTQIALAMDVTAPEGSLAEPPSFTAELFWLVCHDRCIPQRATVELTLPLATDGATPKAANQALLKPSRERLPQPWESLRGAALTETEAGWNIQAPGCSELEFFPSPDLPPTYQGRVAQGETLTLKFSSPTPPAGLLRARCDGSGPRYFRLNTKGS